MKELIVDLFAGGGGASQGIKLALGRDPDIAINHDIVAIAMHSANHPGSTHYHEEIWKVVPMEATQGRRVGLLWASPDCKHFSRAKGGPPKRDKEIRALAWVVVKWAQQVKPRVIILENVEEFATWGPLDRNGKIIDRFNGFTFRTFVWQLERQGYRVEHRSLRACDYGAPTIRKRLFLIARRDGARIVWPEPSHGPGTDLPYRSAAEIIEWSIPCPSIFERKRPLAENTMRRIAQGIKRYVIAAADPFIITYYGPKRPDDFRGQAISDPLRTQTADNRFGLIIPHLQRQFGNSIGVAAFMAQHNGGYYEGTGRPADAPLSTIVHRGAQQQLVTSHLVKFKGTSRDGPDVRDPIHTIQAGGLHYGEVRAFLTKYFGTAIGQSLNDPAHTLTAKDRLGLVTVSVAGEPYVIADIGMRMLAPRELFRAQGFDDDYRIDIEVNGRKISKANQVRMCGNSVCPPIAAALVEANALEGWNAVRRTHSI